MIVSLFRSFYPYFLPLVALGIILRIREKKWSRGETILLLLFAGHAALVLLQIFFGGSKLSRRYLLTGAPLLFGWAGYALCKLASWRWLRWLLPVALLLLAADALRPSLEYVWKPRKREAYSVLRQLAPVIRQDWQAQGGIAVYAPTLDPHVYHSPKRPLVLCERFPLLGYASGGSGISCCDHLLPQPDYRIFVEEPVTAPYVEIHRIIHAGRTYRVGKLSP